MFDTNTRADLNIMFRNTNDSNKIILFFLSNNKLSLSNTVLKQMV